MISTQYVVYFLIAFGSSTVGALTGMGGGVIIKPVCDVLGQYDVSTIGVLSSITVFAMSAVSIGKQALAKRKIPLLVAVPLASGSVCGGWMGQGLLSVLTEGIKNQTVTTVQNAVLAVLIVIVCLYMNQKEDKRTLHWSGLLPALLTGVILGTLSSFLGIGGGPVNVAVMIFLFSFDIKTATSCSLITILFAQISKLISVAMDTGFGAFDLSIAPVMVAGAVIGGLLGAALNKKLSDKSVEAAFNIVQLLVLILAGLNIIRNIMY